MIMLGIQNQLVKGTKYSEPLRDCADTLEAMNSFSWELFSYHGANPGTFLYEPSGIFSVFFCYSLHG